MPTSYDCEDDECVDGSAISPAIVYVHVFRTSKKGTIVFEDGHPLELSVVHMYSYFRGHCSIISTHGTRMSLALFPGSSRPSFCQLSAALGMRL